MGRPALVAMAPAVDRQTRHFLLSYWQQECLSPHLLTQLVLPGKGIMGPTPAQAPIHCPPLAHSPAFPTLDSTQQLVGPLKMLTEPRLSPAGNPTVASSCF